MPLVEIFHDHGGIDDRRAVVDDRRHDAVRIELQVIGLQLIAGEEVELHFLEPEVLRVKHEADALAAGRLRRVIEDDIGHGLFSDNAQA